MSVAARSALQPVRLTLPKRTAKLPQGGARADVLLVTATSIETKAVLKTFRGLQSRPMCKNGRVYFDLGVVNGARVMMTQCEMGTGGLDGSQQSIANGISVLSPSVVILVGIAFGISEKTQRVGEVLVSERIRPYELQRVGTKNGRKRIVLRDDRPHGTPWLINLCRGADLSWTRSKVDFGTILSGAKLIDNLGFRDELIRLEPEAIGGEMEAAGVYVACHRNVDWIVIKAVCDFADGRKGKDKQCRQKLAADNAARFTKHVLEFAKVDWLADKGGLQKVEFRFFGRRGQGRYNQDFYKYFIDTISAARSNIYITGEGFTFADEEGTNLAKCYVDAFRQALARGVHVVRVQTQRQPKAEWTNMLAELCASFPDNLEIYVLREGKAGWPPNVCVIDPDDNERSVVEVMLSAPKFFGSKTYDIAESAMFIEQSSTLAQEFCRQILGLTSEEVSHRPASATELISLLAAQENYFAYGSNMSKEQMLTRAPNATVVGVGVLRDYQLVFNRKGSYRFGRVASVCPSNGHRVYGVVYSLSTTELQALDRIEDCPIAYRRVKEEVMTLDGRRYECQVYQAVPQGIFRPDREYLKLLIRAASDMSLPMEYIRELKALLHPKRFK